MGFAQHVVGRVGTEGAFTVHYRSKECGLVSKDDVMLFLVRKRELAKSHKARTRCC